MTTLNARTASNSATIVDFNKEVAGLMSDAAHAAGRELKLAVAIYNAPADFAVADILGGVGGAKGSKSDAMRKSLLVRSPAFKSHIDKAASFKKAASQKSMKGYAAKADYEAAAKTVIAALSMFERALTVAYFFYAGSVTIDKVTDKTATIQFHRAVTIGDASYDVGTKDLFTRKSLHEAGRKLGSERGLFAKAKAGKSGAGAALITGTQKTVTDTAAMLASAVSAMPSAGRIEIASSADFIRMGAETMRALFASEGKIDIRDVVQFIRDNMTGVSVETGERNERKPRNVSPVKLAKTA